MDAALKRRAAAKGWVTREATKLEALIASNAPTHEGLDAIAQLEIRLDNLDQAQDLVENSLSIEDLERDIAEAADYRDSKRKVLIDAKNHYSASAHSNQNANYTESTGNIDLSSSISAPNHVALPKLHLPYFSGDVTEFYSFFQTFDSVIHGTDLPVISKFSYLLSLLKGEAAAAVKGLALHTENYDVARRILERRFGRPEKIINSNIQQLLNISPPARFSIQEMWRFYDNVQSRVRNLEALGITGEKYGVILTPIILHRLPEETRLEWSRVCEGKEGDLEALLSFLGSEIERRERSSAFVEQQSLPEGKRKRAPPSACALLASGDNDSSECGLCSGLHTLSKCERFLKLNHYGKKNTLKKLGLCFICFRKHLAQNCDKKCELCFGKHNKLLCFRSGKDQTEKKDSQMQKTLKDDNLNVTSMVYSHSCVSNRSTLMQVVRAELGKRTVTFLFDSGADRSFIKGSLARELNLERVGQEEVAFSCFGKAKPERGLFRNIYRLRVKGEELLLTEIESICSPMRRAPIPPHLLKVFHDVDLPLSEDYSNSAEVSVDVLIGLDYFWSLVTTNSVKSDNGLVAQETLLGWMLSGSWGDGQRGDKNCLQFLCLNDIPESMIRNMWELESLGISSCDKDGQGKSKVWEDFTQNISFEDGRYSVGLPWKSEALKARLVNNESLAKKRLDGLNRRLEKNPRLQGEYDKVFTSLEEAGIIHEVPQDDLKPSHPVFYLPHRPVVKEESISTKVRPVFDASVVSYNGLSLNDCMETGPCLLPNLVSVLLRFRRWKFAFSADITKAFLQIRVNKEDQDVHRFLWSSNGKIRVMRLDRVPFGNKASPFLLNATIKHHLAQFPSSLAKSELSENLYVDDLLSGADSADTAYLLMTKARDILARAGMVLTKWSSNSAELSEKIFQELESKHSGSECTKVLGLKWSAVGDVFSFSSLDIPDGLIITKRLVLSFIARQFDPLGFLSPFTISAKLLFQGLWRDGVGWDVEISSSSGHDFQVWLNGLRELQSWRISRCLVQNSWSAAKCVELHVFCDASQQAYGSCVYLKVIENEQETKVSFVMSKVKVAPLKKISLPRLELMAALVGARLLKFVQDSLRLPDSTTYKCYTDSMITLAWIKSDPDRWKQFVSNRVRDIQNLTNPACWLHCAGHENPADLLTRGITASALIRSQIWIHGPTFLSASCPVTHFPSDDICFGGFSVEDEKQQSTQILSCRIQVAPLLDISRWSSFSRAVRVVAWLLRFIARSRKKHDFLEKEDLGREEIIRAENRLLQWVQEEAFPEEKRLLKEGKKISRSSSIRKLTPFFADDGFLRVRGRLHFSPLSYQEKHPIILPKGPLSVLLIEREHKFLGHAGVNHVICALREKYWIVGLRGLAKRVKRSCFYCQRQDALPCVRPEPPLPEFRLRRTVPFGSSGVDHAGPLYCRDSGDKKLYIVLFTCAVIRAIHLELVDSLNVVDFLLAFRRFASRRGVPSLIYSDNARTFQKAKLELVQQLGSGAPEWSFIVPRAPWWGGWWERLVRNVKTSLRKCIGNRTLSRVELETVLHEVEACVNSRPLTFVGDEIDSGHALTPSHFLLGRNNHLREDENNTPPTLNTGKDLQDRYFYQQATLERFWHSWSQEYLKSLQPVNMQGHRGSLKVGSVVMIREDNCRRMSWPLGVVSKIFAGKDGVGRAIEVRTKNGVLVRPIQRLYRLEALSDSHNEIDGEKIGDTSTPPTNPEGNNQSASMVTRHGRTVRPRRIFDL